MKMKMKLSLLLLGLLLGVTAASAAVQLKISSGGEDLCIGGAVEGDMPLWVNTCRPDAEDQIMVRTGETFQLKASGSTPLCLTARYDGIPTDDADVVYAPCDGDSQQQWQVVGETIVNGIACLATDENPPTPGNDVGLEFCEEGKASQKWRVESLDGEDGDGGKGGGSKKKGGLSNGSVFLIIVLVFTIVYVAGGIAYNKFVKGLTGIQTCPNLGFWLALPGLVNAGVRFTLNGCKNKDSEETYEEI